MTHATDLSTLRQQRGIFQRPNEARHEINYRAIDGVRRHMMNLKPESWDASGDADTAPHKVLGKHLVAVAKLKEEK